MAHKGRARIDRERKRKRKPKVKDNMTAPPTAAPRTENVDDAGGDANDCDGKKSKKVRMMKTTNKKQINAEHFPNALCNENRVPTLEPQKAEPQREANKR